MAKKTNKQKLIAKMDKLWSLIVREPGRCAVCGLKHGLEAHHLIPRGNHLFRFDLNNGICLCKSHHTYSGELSAHGRKGSSMYAGEQFISWMKDYKPDQWQWYQENKHIKVTGTLYITDYEAMYEKLK